MKKFLSVLLAFLMVAAIGVTALAAELVDSSVTPVKANEQGAAEGEEVKFTSTRVQGFSVASQNSNGDAAYLVESKAGNHDKNTGNRGRWHDAANYSIWKFDTTGALTAEFIVAFHNEAAFAVSTDGVNFTEFFSTEGARVATTLKTFDLTEYINGNEMYIKTYDSKPVDEQGKAHGWGSYIEPTGTFFRTTVESTYNTVEAPMSTSFVHMSDESKPYTLMNWFSGTTGTDSHPFYDAPLVASLATNELFGCHVEFAFPTSPAHKYGCVYMPLMSNYTVLASNDYQNWVQIATGNANVQLKPLDVSAVMGKNDVVYIRVIDNDLTNGNGPQIGVNRKITFYSRAEAAAEVVLDDCSTDAHWNPNSYDHKMTYNADLGAVSTSYTQAGNNIMRWGKGTTPVDARGMTHFEMDVYVDGNIPDGFLKDFTLEVVNQVDGKQTDTLEIQWGNVGKLYNGGWQHIILAVNSAEVTGDIDWSKIDGIRFFSVNKPEATYTLAVRNMKFTNDPQLFVKNNTDPRNLGAGTTGAGTDVRGGKWDFAADFGTPKYLSVDVYVKDISTIVAGYGIRYEITSYGNCDHREREFSIHNYLYKNGWNHLLIPISEAGVSDGEPDWHAINYTRVHCQVGAGNEYYIANTRLLADAEGQEPIAFASSKINSTAVQAVPFSTPYDFTGSNAVAMDIYVGDSKQLVDSEAYICIELSSAGVHDKDEIQFEINASVESGQNAYKINPAALKTGWNHVVLPFSLAEIEGSPDISKINFMRIHNHGMAKGGSGTFAVANIEGVKVESQNLAPVNEEVPVQVYGDFVPGTVVTVEKGDASKVEIDTIAEELDELITDDSKYKYAVAAVYDLTAMKGDTVVQPVLGSSVKVVIPPVPATSFDTIHVYHVSDEGDRTELEFTTDNNGNIVVEVPHFSSIVVVRQSLDPNANPYTGDMMVAVYALIAVIAAGAFVLVLKKAHN